MENTREATNALNESGISNERGDLQRLLDAGPINVGDRERLMSTIGGGLLFLTGLARGTWGGVLLSTLGGIAFHRGLTGHCAVYGRYQINTAEPYRSASTSVPHGRGIKIEKTITVNRTPEELYHFWRNFENLPRIMSHLESITVLGDKRSHWVARGPLEMKFEWDAEIIHEEENKLIGWRSIGQPDVDHAGSVHFKAAPGKRGTEMKVVLRYDPPGGKAGAAFAKLFRNDPERQIEEDLRHFKQVMEAGEIAVAGEASGHMM